MREIYFFFRYSCEFIELVVFGEGELFFYLIVFLVWGWEGYGLFWVLICWWFCLNVRVMFLSWSWVLMLLFLGEWVDNGNFGFF